MNDLILTMWYISYTCFFLAVIGHLYEIKKELKKISERNNEKKLQ